MNDAVKGTYRTNMVVVTDTDNTNTIEDGVTDIPADVTEAVADTVMTVEETDNSMTVGRTGNTTMKPMTILTILTKTMMLIIQQRAPTDGLMETGKAEHLLIKSESCYWEKRQRLLCSK